MAGIGDIWSIGTGGWWPEDGADMHSVGTDGWWLTSVVSLQLAIGEAALGDSGIQALVGLRVYRIGHVPQGADMPYLVYERVADPPHRDQLGQKMREATYLFHCVAKKVSDAMTLSNAVLSWLDNFRGMLGLPTRPVEVRHAGLTSRGHTTEPPSDGSARGPQIVQQEYTLFYLP